MKFKDFDDADSSGSRASKITTRAISKLPLNEQAAVLEQAALIGIAFAKADCPPDPMSMATAKALRIVADSIEAVMRERDNRKPNESAWDIAS